MLINCLTDHNKQILYDIHLLSRKEKMKEFLNELLSIKGPAGCYQFTV